MYIQSTQAVERALDVMAASLEASQADTLRRLSSEVGRAVDGIEDSLEAAMRAELFRALEPVRMLPQMLPQLGAGGGALQQVRQHIRQIGNRQQRRWLSLDTSGMAAARRCYTCTTSCQ